ncbi:MAG: hypothetical protein O3A36_01140 [bacterium]|nr:hypothetical protein [bacterium]
METSVGTGSITIGRFASKKALLAVIKQSSTCRATPFALSMIEDNAFKVSSEEKTLRIDRCDALHLIQPRVLLKVSVLLQSLRNRQGLCPAELGVCLCLELGGLEEDETLYVAMETILNSNNEPCIFKVSLINGKITLNAYCAWNDLLLPVNAQIVYVVPQQ